MKHGIGPIARATLSLHGYRAGPNGEATPFCIRQDEDGFTVYRVADDVAVKKFPRIRHARKFIGKLIRMAEEN